MSKAGGKKYNKVTVLSDGTDGSNIRKRIKVKKTKLRAVLLAPQGLREGKSGAKFIRFDGTTDEATTFASEVDKVLKQKFLEEKKTFFKGLDIVEDVKATMEAPEIINEDEYTHTAGITLFPSQYSKGYQYNTVANKLKPATFGKMLNYADLEYEVVVNITTIDFEIIHQDEKRLTIHLTPFINVADLTMLWTGVEKSVDMEELAKDLERNELKAKATGLAEFLRKRQEPKDGSVPEVEVEEGEVSQRKKKARVE